MQKYVSEKKLETHRSHETSVQKAFPVKPEVAIKLMPSFSPISHFHRQFIFWRLQKLSFATLSFYKSHTEQIHIF